MKNLFLFLFAMHISVMPGDLFFSEYIEGNSNNKALEIFNPGDTPVELSVYRIVQSVNGGGWKDYYSFPADATIAPYSVYTIIHGKVSNELFNHNQADEITNSAVVSFNGNDARGLLKIAGIDSIIVDLIGIPDQDPGNGWAVAGIPNATMNRTLVRKPDVHRGNTDWAASAGSNSDNSEWHVMSTDYFQNLGRHDYTPLASNPGSIESRDIKVYPNPADHVVYVECIHDKFSTVITDISGRPCTITHHNDLTGKIDISGLEPGIYIISIFSRTRVETIRFIKND
jgi:hypothetical protein